MPTPPTTPTAALGQQITDLLNAHLDVRGTWSEILGVLKLVTLHCEYHAMQEYHRRQLDGPAETRKTDDAQPESLSERPQV